MINWVGWSDGAVDYLIPLVLVYKIQTHDLLTSQKKKGCEEYPVLSIVHLTNMGFPKMLTTVKKQGFLNLN